MMQKYIYKIVFLFFVFVGALCYFGGDIKEEKVEEAVTTTVAKATFPLIYLESQDHKINILRGYSGTIETGMVRASITPVSSDGVLTISVVPNSKPVKRLEYELVNLADGSVLESGVIKLKESGKEKNSKEKKGEVKLTNKLDKDKEYPLRLTAVTSEGKKIYFFTRVKQTSNAHLKEKLKFVNEFHNNTIDKSTSANNVKKYLETDSGADTTNLSKVTIQSNVNMVRFGNLKPEVLTKSIIPTIKELNDETAAVELKYVMEAETDSGKERYNVVEFYRVRWSSDRMYLLNYQRTMEALFDPDLASLSKKELKLGITGGEGLELTTNKTESAVCFVKERELWYYDSADSGTITKVFSFLQEESNYIQDNYDQHEIRVLDMDEEGNTNFMVYGYMNRGDYEGRVAVVLYRYVQKENRIEEMAYIPVAEPYAMLKEDLDSFSFVNQGDIFYFAFDDMVYSYNMVTKALSEVAEGIKRENYITPSGGKFIAWVNSNTQSKATTMKIMNMETGQIKTKNAPKGESIKLLGSIENNFIYGYVKNEDIKKDSLGSTIVPVYQFEITTGEGVSLKKYKKKGYYVTSISVKDNIISLERIKKEGDRYVEAKQDHVLSADLNHVSELAVTTRVTDKAFMESYLSLPRIYDMKEQPKIRTTDNTVITKDTTVHMKKDTAGKQYYVSALGGIQSSSKKEAWAIADAETLMGVVLNEKQQLIWERGAKQQRYTISSFPTIESKQSKTACVQALLKQQNVAKKADALAESEKSVLKVLNQYSKYRPINLTGCTLSQVLYYVSNDRPVIAMKNSKDAVCIYGYDEFNVLYMDPVSGTKDKMGMKDAEKIFRGAGNVFVSYLDAVNKK